jgi:hypothetical protein
MAMERRRESAPDSQREADQHRPERERSDLAEEVDGGRK